MSKYRVDEAVQLNALIFLSTRSTDWEADLLSTLAEHQSQAEHCERLCRLLRRRYERTGDIEAACQALNAFRNNVEIRNDPIEREELLSELPIYLLYAEEYAELTSFVEDQMKRVPSSLGALPGRREYILECSRGIAEYYLGLGVESLVGAIRRLSNMPYRNSFGPNMWPAELLCGDAAWDLVEVREAVITYIDSYCGKWPGYKKVGVGWIDAIRTGSTPVFLGRRFVW